MRMCNAITKNLTIVVLKGNDRVHAYFMHIIMLINYS